jgi:hypothetical protein
VTFSIGENTVLNTRLICDVDDESLRSSVMKNTEANASSTIARWRFVLF